MEDDVCCERCLTKRPPSASCCDICNPHLALDLFDSMEPPPKSTRAHRQPKTAALPEPELACDTRLRSLLKEWRDEEAKRQWGPFFPLGGFAIISDPQVEKIINLAHAGRLTDAGNLKSQLAWCYSSKYAGDVARMVCETHPTSITDPSGLSSKQPNTIKLRSAPTPKRDSDNLMLADTSGPPVKRPRVHRCSACGAVGHIGE
jgi:hypothetical protein